MPHKIIVFQKPEKKRYNASRDEDNKKMCPPVKMGFGCYGDCMDCFRIFEKKV